MNDIMDLHTHTISSGHAYSTLSEMAKSAAQKGVKLLGSSDHAPMLPGGCHELFFANYKVIPREFYGIKLLMGSELNIMDYKGTVDLPIHYLKRLDYAIASIHTPCLTPGTVSENTAAYIGAIKNPYVNIIGHPDDSRYPVDYETIVCAAKEYNKLLEVNSSSFHPQSPRCGTHENYAAMLSYCIKHGVSIIVNSDAHIENDVKNHTAAMHLLDEINFPEELVVNYSLKRVAAYIPKISEYWHEEA